MFNDFSLLLSLEVPARRAAPRLRTVASREEEEGGEEMPEEMPGVI